MDKSKNKRLLNDCWQYSSFYWWERLLEFTLFVIENVLYTLCYVAGVNEFHGWCCFNMRSFFSLLYFMLQGVPNFDYGMHCRNIQDVLFFIFIFKFSHHALHEMWIILFRLPLTVITLLIIIIWEKVLIGYHLPFKSNYVHY